MKPSALRANPRLTYAQKRDEQADQLATACNLSYGFLWIEADPSAKSRNSITSTRALTAFHHRDE
jgi:hypothetical protein